jgi:hypothetical protein
MADDVDNDCRGHSSITVARSSDSRDLDNAVPGAYDGDYRHPCTYAMSAIQRHQIVCAAPAAG